MPNGNMRDVIESRDPERIKRKLGELLQNVGTGTGRITIYSALLCSLVLETLAVEKLQNSSKRLECLTIILIVLTIALIVIGFPPFLEVVKR